MLGQRFAPVLAAACIGGAILLPGVASAGPPTVAFHGNCGLLGVGASSKPDTGSVSVRSGGTVTFVNHLDQSAHLMINGADRGVVPADNQVAVLFRQGRVSVTMLPGCLLGGGGDVGAVTVNVTADSASGPGSPVGRPPGADRSPEARTTGAGRRYPAVRRCAGRRYRWRPRAGHGSGGGGYRRARTARQAPPRRPAGICGGDLRGWRVRGGNPGYHRSAGNPGDCHIR